MISTTIKIKSVWDNGGESLDRYTVVMNHSYADPRTGTIFHHALGVSENPDHFCQWTAVEEGDHLGKRINFGDLPEAVRKHAPEGLIDRINGEVSK